MHDDLGWKSRTTWYILPRHWLYEWFSQFHRCGTYSVLSPRPSIIKVAHTHPNNSDVCTFPIFQFKTIYTFNSVLSNYISCSFFIGHDSSLTTYQTPLHTIGVYSTSNKNPFPVNTGKYQQNFSPCSTNSCHHYSLPTFNFCPYPAYHLGNETYLPFLLIPHVR